MRRQTIRCSLGAIAVIAGACSSGTRGGTADPAPYRPPPSTTNPSPPPPPPPPEREPPRASETGSPLRLEIPGGHLPEIGQCRVWMPGVPAGRQRGPKSISCLVIGTPPPGSWMVFRPTTDNRTVRVRVMHARRSGVITVVRVYRDGRWVRDMRPEHEPRDNQLYHVRPERPDTVRGGEGPTVMRPFPPTPPPPPAPAARDTTERPTVMRPFPRTPPPAPPPPAVEKPRLPPPPPPPGPARDSTPPSDPRPPVERPVERPGQPLVPPPPPPPPPPPRLDVSPLDIPPGHMPEVGECRIWVPGRPPGRQPPPKSRACAGIEAVAPAGSWIVHGPSNEENVVYVRVVDARRAGVVVLVRVYDVETNQLVREMAP